VVQLCGFSIYDSDDIWGWFGDLRGYDRESEMLAGGGIDKDLLGEDSGAIVGVWLDMWFLFTEFGRFSI